MSNAEGGRGHTVRRRTTRLGLASLLGCAGLTIGLVGPVSTASGASASGAVGPGRPAVHAGAALALPAPVPPVTTAASCPPPPRAPKKVPYYKLNGRRWNPRHPISYVLDTKRLTTRGIARRTADIRAAMREAAEYSGLEVEYRGTEKAQTAPRFSTIQFVYNSSDGYSATPYIVTVDGADTRQMAAGIIDVGESFGYGFGRYDAKSPAHSPEGELLLQAVGFELGLGTVKGTDRQVMNASPHGRYWYGHYQGGDERGLYEVGSVKGCGGFHE